MSDGTAIEWTDATWNPVTGCSVVSPGCTNCYAMRLAGTRLRNHATRRGLTRDTKAGPVWTGDVRFNARALTEPLRWTKPRSIFVCAHGDLFHENVPDEWIDRIFAVMALCPQHTFQVLTKRSARMRAYLSTGRAHPVALEALSVTLQCYSVNSNVGKGIIIQGDIAHLKDWPLPNVWLGVSAEDQTRADERIPDLLATPAAVRWVSAEPLLGPIDFERVGTLESVGRALPKVIERETRGRPSTGAGSICGAQIEGIGSVGSSITFFQTPDHMGGFTAASPRAWPRLDWVVVGGESGPNARPMHPQWARDIRDQCAAAGVPFFFKQWGKWLADECLPEYFTPAENPLCIHGADFSAFSKKTAGRLLDGREHSAMPGRA